MNRLNLFFGFFILLLLPPFLSAQPINLVGFIYDSKTGEKVENVNIFDQLSGIGTISDNKGYFKLLLDPGKINLFISEAGFKTFNKVFELQGDTLLNVRLILGKDDDEKQLQANDGKVRNDTSVIAGFLKQRHK